MNDLGQLLRDQFASDADDAPMVHDLTLGAARRALRIRRTRRFAGSIAAAVAVVVVLGASLWINARPTAGNQPVQRPVHGSKQVEVPSGQRLVSYHGIEIQVPRSWPVWPVQCDVTTMDAVVPETNSHYPCDPGSSVPPISPKISVVQLVPDTLAADVGLARQAVTVNGIPALTGTGPGHGRTGSGLSFEGRTVTVLRLPDPGVLIEVTSPIAGLAQKIFDSVRLAPTDYLGCAASLPSKLPTGNTASTTFMGDKALVSAVVCTYVPMLSPHGKPPYWLAASRELIPEQISYMRQSLDLPARQVTDPSVIDAWIADPASFSWYVFTYRDGTTRTLCGMRVAAPQIVSDGRRWVEISDHNVFLPGAWGGGTATEAP